MALKHFSMSLSVAGSRRQDGSHSWLCQAPFLAAMLCMCLSSQLGAAESSEDSGGNDVAGVPANVVMAPELRTDLFVSKVKLRDLGALKQAQVAVENVSRARYTLEYKFEWTDEDGFQAGTTRTWHRFVLAPGQREFISSTGQVPSASNAVFSLRLPDDYFLNRDEEPPWRQQEPTIPPPEHKPRGDDPNELPGR